jgi:hypothetical protein
MSSHASPTARGGKRPAWSATGHLPLRRRHARMQLGLRHRDRAGQARLCGGIDELVDGRQ